MLCVRFATKKHSCIHHIVTFVGIGHWTGFDMYRIVNLFTGVQGCVNNNWSLLGHFPGPARNCWRFYYLLGLLPEQVHPGWTPWLHVQNQVCDHAIMSRYPGILKCLDIIHTTDWTQVQQVQLSPGEHKAADDAETSSCCFLPLEKVEFKFFFGHRGNSVFGLPLEKVTFFGLCLWASRFEEVLLGGLQSISPC